MASIQQYRTDDASWREAGSADAQPSQNAVDVRLNSALTLFGRFISDVFQVLRKRAILLVVLGFLSAALEGLTLALLLPLFFVLGVGGSGSGSLLTGALSAVFEMMHVPMTLLSIGFAFLLLIVLSAAVFLLAAYYSTRLQSEYAAYWRRHLFDALTSAKWTYLKRISRADIASVMVTETQRLDTAFYLTNLMFASISAIVFQIVIAFFVAPLVTVVILCFGLVLFVATQPLISRAVSFGSSLTEANANLHARVDELTAAMKLVKATASEPEANRLLDGAVSKIERWNFAYAFDIQIVRGVFEYLSAAAIALMLIVGPSLLNVDVATILVVVAMFVRLFPRITGLRHALQSVMVVLPAYSRAREIYDGAIAERERASGLREVSDKPVSLRLSGLTVIGAEGMPILENVDLDARAGSFTAIVGVSGAGKTTLIDCVLGLNEPTLGDVSVDGTSLREISPTAWRHKIGYLGQDPVLFAGTIRDNVAWGQSGIDDRDIVSALMDAGADFVLRMPKGIETVIGQGGGSLSGGERQRIALARAFCRASQLLVLDEATSAIDPENEARILDVINRVKGRMTVLAISHRLPAIKGADQIVVMEAGRIVERGQFEDLLAGGGRFSELWHA